MRTSSLNVLFINTWTPWTRDVHSGGSLTREMLCFFKSFFVLSVCSAQWTSAIRIFPSEFWSIGFLKEFAHSVEIHSFIISWSHQAFYWYMTLTHRSQLCFSLALIRRPLPRKITVGVTLSTASANTVNWTVACLLSRPDCPLCAKTSLTPFLS